MIELDDGRQCHLDTNVESTTDYRMHDLEQCIAQINLIFIGLNNGEEIVEFG